MTIALNGTGASVVWVYSWNATGAGAVTSIQYAGVNMTDSGAGEYQYSAGEFMQAWYLLNPATGTNNVVINYNSSSGQKACSCTSWSGTSTTTMPDAHATNNSGGAGTPINSSITSSANNCVALQFGRAESGTYTASTNATLADNPTFTYTANSAVKTPAGSINMQVTYTGGAATWGTIMVTMPPPATVNKSNFLTFM